MLNSSWDFAVDERLIQPSIVNDVPTSSEFASGTRPVSLTPSYEAAVFASPTIAPAAPSVTPPRYVPLFAFGDESSSAVPDGSPKRQ